MGDTVAGAVDRVRSDRGTTLLIMLGILCLQRQCYGWLYALIPAIAFLRPGALAFALFGAYRWASRRQEPLRQRELVAARVIRRWDAYLETELSWRRLWIGDEGISVSFEG